MAKQQILLVDADTSSARLLEVSLRGAGFNIATAASAEDALGKLEHGAPDLILTEARLPGVDGFAFVRTLRARPELADTPIVFLTEQGALEDKLRGLELGVDDYLAKPIMVREVVTRVQLLLARKKQQRTLAEPQARTRFSGSLEDVAVVDVLQTVAISGKSGVASVKRGEREALLYFDRGQIIDAEVGDLRGEEAVYRTITWATGTFDVEFRAIERERVIEVSHQGLLMEGLRRVDELGRLAEQLPPETAVIDVDHEALASRLNEIPDELNGILRLIDGKRTLLDLIDASPFDDLSTLTVLSKFYFEGLLQSANPEPVEWAPGSRPAAAAVRDSAPPASERARQASSVLTPVPPPSQPAQAAPTLPAPLESLRETQRPTPLPASARPAAHEAEAKLTPKGIVNVGASPPPPPKHMPSPFRAANDANRRSPIPMPVGNHSRANGATGHSGSRSNGARESRTMHGLSATPLQRAAAAPDPSSHRPEMEVAPDAKRRASDAVVIGVVSREHAEPPAVTVPAPAPRSAAALAGAPGSNPEPEEDFFEAGDEGTYAGGPHSIVPQRRVVTDSDEPPPASRPHTTPSRRGRVRRSTLVVAAVIALAAIPLVVAGVRHFGARAEPSPEPGAFAAQPTPPPSVQQPGDGLGVAPPSTDVSPPPGAEPALAIDAGVPAAESAAGLAAPEAPPTPAVGEPPAADGTGPAAAAPVPAEPSRAPRPPAAPRKAPTAPAPTAAPAPESAPAAKDAPAQRAPLKPGEKPPTAAYPLPDGPSLR